MEEKLIKVKICRTEVVISGERPCPYFYDTAVRECVRFFLDTAAKYHCRIDMRAKDDTYRIALVRQNGCDIAAVAVDVICWLNHRQIPHTVKKIL